MLSWYRSTKRFAVCARSSNSRKSGALRKKKAAAIHHEIDRETPIVTVLGHAKMLRSYYWCSGCRQGQFPSDVARDMEDTEFSPGVRRMLALVGSECSSFDRGRQQMELLADLRVTAKAVERVTEAIGADIGCREQQTIQQAMQLELPVAVGQSIPVMYVQMDATGQAGLHLHPNHHR